MSVTSAAVRGFVAPGFAPVRAAFERNFVEGEELGTAFAALHAGLAGRAAH